MLFLLMSQVLLQIDAEAFLDTLLSIGILEDDIAALGETLDLKRARACKLFIELNKVAGILSQIGFL